MFSGFATYCGNYHCSGVSAQKTDVNSPGNTGNGTYHGFTFGVILHRRDAKCK